jgi:thiol:disulfide interchange protein DsbD
VLLKARADWLICKDVCIPGGADLQLILPVRDAAAPSRHAALFQAAQARTPKPVTLEAASATIEDDRMRIAFRPQAAVERLEFFPLEESRVEPSAAQSVRSESGFAALYLARARTAAPEFTRLAGVLVANGGPDAADRGGWAGVIDLPLLAGSVGQLSPDPAAAPEGAGVAIDASAMTLGLALLGAFIGGLILNLMPCVFPVLSLKLLSLMQHQRVDEAARLPRASLRAHGGAFASGVVLCFVLLAALLIGLRSVGEQLGWGFQLQTPWVVAALTLLFFVIGLNLLGVFELTFGGALASSGAAQRLRGDRLSGSFATGVLAVIVAAPCTAPFMGAALGYAVTQPTPIALAVFAVLGAGMALPYVALTWAPALLARLPRPGAWMLRFKQAMAFPMFATCIWLLWVLAQQVGIDAAAMVLGGLLLTAFAAWALGLAQMGARRWRWVALLAAPIGLYAVFGLVLAGPAAPTSAAVGAGDAWQSWSRQAQQEKLASGTAVFVDFTAAWCVTCQANKRLVLGRDSVREAFAQRGVTLMRADWTNRDDQITRELARFNRNGVPLYVLYDGNGGAQVLPELLTEGIVLDALARL